MGSRRSEQLLSFRVNDEQLAIPAAAIREVIRLPAIVRVPHAPPALVGLGNLRGTVLSILSLASREPELSAYGWSKGEADTLVRASGLDWTIVRPPAIYGPGDLEMLELFRVARFGLALLPPGGRISVIEVSDLGRLLLALAAADRFPGEIDPDDGRAGGWTHPEFARAIGRAVGRKVLALSLPRAVLMGGAYVDRALRGKRAKLTPDRVSYFCHPDWVANPAKRAPANLWTPQVETEAGLAETARWYRAKGLL